MKEINIAIFGFGFMGKTYLHASKIVNDFYPDAPKIKVKKILVSKNKSEKDKKLIETRHNVVVTSNIDEILSDLSIKAVYIGSPNNFHFEHFESAIKSNKHILCDKPLGVDSNETKKMLELANNNNNLITNVVFQYRFIPAITEIKKMIDNGNLGKILKFRISYLHGSYVDERPITWRLKDKTGGALVDLGPHVLDIVYYLLGEFNVTDKKIKTKMENRVVDDFAWILCETIKDSADGFIEVSRVSTGCIDELRLEIHGKLGSVKWNLEDLNFFNYFDKNASKNGYTRIPAFFDKDSISDFPPPKVTSGWLRSHINCLYYFINQLNGKSESSNKIAKISEGHYIQKLIDIIKSE
tara:strand:- start:569 stop:1630 length:1062 start_codon:yes stop_codon:yes gene_type:complete